jgi:hypothetical protein
MTSEKPKYEKPVAVPLGEGVKGSGQCKAGSGVIPGAFTCSRGTSASNCGSGTSPNLFCIAGFTGPSE